MQRQTWLDVLRFSKSSGVVQLGNQIDGLVQERCNSIANALELRLSCTNRLRCYPVYLPKLIHNHGYTGRIDLIPDWLWPLMVYVTMTLWHGFFFFFCITGALWGNHQSLVDSPIKEPVMWNFGVYIFVDLNKLFNEQLSCRWFEIPWHLCDIAVMFTM